jgi:hypothetical protein
MEKCGTVGQATNDNIARAHFLLLIAMHLQLRMKQ